jgi:tRNA(Met) C34 N-acetyltransferase TmcA
MPPAAEYFIGTVSGELVCHLAVCPFFTAYGYRATRLVVMPEWQGAGVGTKFLEWVCEYHKNGNGRCGKKFPTFFHTSHPQLIGFLKYSKRWVLKSQAMYGGNKQKSKSSVQKAQRLKAAKGIKQSQMAEDSSGGSGFGGHFRAVQGFKYLGDKLAGND